MKTPSKEQISEVARLMVAMRWARTSKKERQEFSRMMNAAQGKGTGPRCDCGVMTLKRAKARGRSREHRKTCGFYKH